MILYQIYCLSDLTIVKTIKISNSTRILLKIVFRLGKISRWYLHKRYQSKNLELQNKRMILLNNMWKDKSIATALKIKILKCLICEAWTSRKADHDRIEASEMWFHRRLLTVKWTDRRIDETILNEQAPTRNLLAAINKRTSKYIGHASRNTNLVYEQQPRFMKSHIDVKAEMNGGWLLCHPLRRLTSNTMMPTGEMYQQCSLYGFVSD